MEKSLLWEESVIKEIRKTVFLVDLERQKIKNEEAKGKSGSSPFLKAYAYFLKV